MLLHHFHHKELFFLQLGRKRKQKIPRIELQEHEGAFPCNAEMIKTFITDFKEQLLSYTKPHIRDPLKQT
jgi:hypothetical protein